MNIKGICVEIFQSMLLSLKKRLEHMKGFLYFKLLDVEKFEKFAHTLRNHH